MQEAQALGQFGVLPDHGDAADHVGVTVEVFGGRVQHDVEAKLQRALDPRAGEGVVGHADDAAGAAGAGDGGEVGEAQQRIARGLDHDHACVVLQGRFERRQVGQVDEAEAVPGAALAHLVEQAEGAAVQVVARNDVRAGVEQFEHRGNGRQPRGEGKAPGAAFEVGHAAFQRPARRVVRAPVVQAFVHPGALLQVGGVGVDRRHQRPGRRVRRLPGVDHPGGEALWRGVFILLTHGRDLRKWLSMSVRVIRP
ncbi:hypothetical protein D3C73_1012990 [compost metagenome]